MGRLLLTPGSLWPLLLERSARALRLGALHSIPTEYRYLSQDGVDFLVRVIANLARKAQARPSRPQGAAPANPFLPYEQDLFVADVSDTHVCLLNKFNVVDHHLLLITRVHEDQERLLTLADFEALWACLEESPALGFYNGGTIAGASQTHKHLQLVPLPLASQGPAVPMAPALAAATFSGADRDRARIGLPTCARAAAARSTG